MAEFTPDQLRGMKVAVTGASGNLGTALLRRLSGGT
jgi:nucleoside-diphosphate-sugar epimerase